MATQPDDQQQAFRDALEQLEGSVETPFVPGELERWMESVDDSWQQLQPHLNWLIETWHPEQYSEIGEEDQELVNRVEQMREEDAEIQRFVEPFGGRIAQLKSAVAGIEPDEAKLKPALEAFVSESLEFVIRIRKQEQAVRTWLLEAFDRDRGTVD